MPSARPRLVVLLVASIVTVGGCSTAREAAPPVSGHPQSAVHSADTTPTTPPPRGGRSAHTTPTSAPRTTDPAPPTTTITAPAIPAGSTEVAVLRGDTPGSAVPGGPPTQTVPGSWYGAVSSLPVIAQAAGWLEVRLAQRPDGATAWVPASAAALSVTPDRIVVDLATRRAELFTNNTLTDDFPVGVGAPATPTPTGHYFVAFFTAAPSAGYGPFVIVTSAHSNAITDWDRSGDAIVALHGPIDATADAEIGTTGAAISNGCVRLHDADLAQLREVPAGSPVDIVAA